MKINDLVKKNLFIVNCEIFNNNRRINIIKNIKEAYTGYCGSNMYLNLDGILCLNELISMWDIKPFINNNFLFPLDKKTIARIVDFRRAMLGDLDFLNRFKMIPWEIEKINISDDIEVSITRLIGSNGEIFVIYKQIEGFWSI
jgi:hypothetical protein